MPGETEAAGLPRELAGPGPNCVGQSQIIQLVYISKGLSPLFYFFIVV